MQSLETVPKAQFPSEVKEAVENLLTPVKEEPKDVTTKLKATVGELRQLSNKKAGLQKRVDNAKDQYKLLLGELKMVQEPEAYAKLLKDETKDAAVLEVCLLYTSPSPRDA